MAFFINICPQNAFSIDWKPNVQASKERRRAHGSSYIKGNCERSFISATTTYVVKSNKRARSLLLYAVKSCTMRAPVFELMHGAGARIRARARKQSSHQAMTVVHHRVINQGVRGDSRFLASCEHISFFFPSQTVLLYSWSEWK